MTLKNQNGVTLVELMVVIGICGFMLTSVYTTFITGQATWFTADSAIELRDNIRTSTEKIGRELRESGFNSAATSQVTLVDGGGASSTDLLRFSMPVLCNTGTALLDSSGNVANWGAPLTWGCTTSSCMDENDSCGTLEYKYVQYEVTASNQLVRKVLSPALVVVRTDIIASNVTNMQITQSADQNVITIQLTAQKLSPMRKVITLTKSLDVYLRNRG
ncbi:MAG: prepilin-type N-terminal cleavage/methylation domain-containing protein [Candidatus Omnitrophica bacterium]|nr:prepilin-type N-terminal cleavage/methylation domain-containing protein [Candidatus Omnitrophota bacterium]